MKIDFNTVLKDFDDKHILHDKKVDPETGLELPNQKDRAVTLGDVSVNALQAQFKDEVNEIEPPEKMDRFLIAKNIREKRVLDMRVEDIAKVKKLVGKMYGPLIMGRAYEILDPEDAIDEKTGTRKSKTTKKK